MAVINPSDEMNEEEGHFGLETRKKDMLGEKMTILWYYKYVLKQNNKSYLKSIINHDFYFFYRTRDGWCTK